MTSPNPAQLPTIKSALKFFKVTSYITGVFLILIMVLWAIRLIFSADVWIGGPDGLIALAQFSIDPSTGEKVGLPGPQIPNDFTTISLIIHGWLYVTYLFGDFRLWTLLRWNFMRFLIIALGGVIPFLSFFTERHYSKVAEADLKKVA